MRLTFEESINDTVRDVVTSLIENDEVSNGNISIKSIPLDEADEYDLPESITEDADEVYVISQCVCGTWDQPLGAVSVSYD